MSPSEPKLVMTMRFLMPDLSGRRPALEADQLGSSGAHSPRAHGLRRVALEAQAQFIARPRPQPWIQLRRLLREQPWSPALCNGRQHEHAFHRREPLPDAHPWPTAEREVAVTRTTVPHLRSPAVRVKRVGIRVEAGVTVHGVLTEYDDAPLGDHVLTHWVVFQG